MDVVVLLFLSGFQPLALKSSKKSSNDEVFPRQHNFSPNHHFASSNLLFDDFYNDDVKARGQEELLKKKPQKVWA